MGCATCLIRSVSAPEAPEPAESQALLNPPDLRLPHQSHPAHLAHPSHLAKPAEGVWSAPSPRRSSGPSPALWRAWPLRHAFDVPSSAPPLAAQAASHRLGRAPPI